MIGNNASNGLASAFEALRPEEANSAQYPRMVSQLQSLAQINTMTADRLEQIISALGRLTGIYPEPGKPGAHDMETPSRGHLDEFDAQISQADANLMRLGMIRDALDQLI